MCWFEKVFLTHVSVGQIKEVPRSLATSLPQTTPPGSCSKMETSPSAQVMKRPHAHAQGTHESKKSHRRIDYDYATFLKLNTKTKTAINQAINGLDPAFYLMHFTIAPPASIEANCSTFEIIIFIEVIITPAVILCAELCRKHICFFVFCIFSESKQLDQGLHPSPVN